MSRRPTPPPAAWMTERNLARGRQLWDDGVTATRIAGAIGDGCTKSALLGKARRLGWPPRPSPFGPHKGEVVPRLPDKPHRRPQEGEVRRASPKTLPAPRAACDPLPLAAPTLAFGRCQWPNGERPDWRWCEAPTEGGGPYCPTHRRQAYERTPHRGDAVYGVAW